MSATFRKIDFDIIRKRLQETEAWLNDVGIKTGETRFSAIVEQVNTICDYKAKANIQELVDHFDNELLWYALLESGAFLDIHKAFRELKSHQIPRSKLTEILKGPFLPKDEDTENQNTHSRNTLFELQMAAKINGAGIDVIGFDDVDFVLDEQTFNVQCKRIHSFKRIKDNVQRAYEQIQCRLKADEKQKALICISIDKLSEKDGKILRVKTAKDIGPEMVRITSAFIEANREYWHNYIDIRLIATFIYFQAAAIIGDLNILTRCQLLEIDPIASPEYLQSREFMLITDMAKKLQNSES